MSVVRRFLGMVVAVLVLGSPAMPASAAEPGSAQELAGLWKAKRCFGPDGRGPLAIQRTGATYTADMIGRILPVRFDKGELSFDLPNGQGSFRIHRSRSPWAGTRRL